VRVVAEYQAAEKALDPGLLPDFVSLEGYLSGRLTAAALEMVGPNPPRAGMLRVINEVGRFDISGDNLTVGQKMRDDQAEVFLTLIQPDGTFKAIDKL